MKRNKRILISFLGTNTYQSTTYSWADKGTHETPFVQCALASLWGAERVTILATKSAQDKNGARLQEALTKVNPALEAKFLQIQEGGGIEGFWGMFQEMKGLFEDLSDSSVLLDITHGLRAHPFFTASVLGVLRATEKIPEDFTIVYGEWKKDAPSSPIWDLTLVSELLDWAQALYLFRKTGVAKPVAELSKRVRRRKALEVLSSGGKNFPSFDGLVSAIEAFADDLSTVRIPYLLTGYEQDHAKKPKAVGSAAKLVDSIEICRNEVQAFLPPLALVLDELEQDLQPLVAKSLFGAEGQRAMMVLFQYYLDLGRFAEASVVAREALASRYAKEEAAVEVNSEHFRFEKRQAINELFGKKATFVGTNEHTIAKLRNDIEHGGFNEQPLGAKNLKSQLERLRETIMALEQDLP